jgi:hypothetical protein
MVVFMVSMVGMACARDLAVTGDGAVTALLIGAVVLYDEFGTVSRPELFECADAGPRPRWRQG